MDSINERIRAAVTPIVPICRQDFYGGEETTYCVFFVTEAPEGFGDGEPTGVIGRVSLHLFTPRGADTVELRHRLRRAISAAEDFTAPEVEDASDNKDQIHIFSFEVLEVGW